MNVLLSIKPKFVEKIISGEKKYEFRRTIFKNTESNSIFIYSSSPVKKIVGEMVVDAILAGRPKKLWEQCREFSGIGRKDFFDYFEGKDEAFALRIQKILLFDSPIEPQEIKDNFIPPQSFYYIRDELMSFFDRPRKNFGRRGTRYTKKLAATIANVQDYH
jgi:predicted transcriptional regulator